EVRQRPTRRALCRASRLGPRGPPLGPLLCRVWTAGLNTSHRTPSICRIAAPSLASKDAGGRAVHRPESVYTELKGGVRPAPPRDSPTRDRPRLLSRHDP